MARVNRNAFEVVWKTIKLDLPNFKILIEEALRDFWSEGPWLESLSIALAKWN